MFYTFSTPHHCSWTEQLLFINPSEEPLFHRVSHIATQLIELYASGRYRSCQQAAFGICFQGRMWCWVMLVIPPLVGESLRPSPWLAEGMHVNLTPALREMSVLACSYCRGLEYSIPKYATLTHGLFWAEDKGKEADTQIHTLPSPSLPGRAKQFLSNPRDNPKLLQPRDTPKESTQQILLMSPYLPLSSPTCSPSHSALLEAVNAFPLSCHLSTNLLLFW